MIQSKKNGKAALVTAGRVAQVLNISLRRVYQLLEKDVLPRASRGRFNLAVCMMSYIRHLQGDVQRRYGLSPEDSLDSLFSLQKTRIRWVRARADLAEHELKIMRDGLIPTALVNPCLAVFAERIRRNVEAMMERIAPQIVGPDGLGLSRTAIKAVMQKEVHAALTALAQEAADETCIEKDFRRACKLAGISTEKK